MRYTARSELGRIQLFAPPPVPPAAQTPIAPGEPSPAALVAGISDRHIRWFVARFWNGEIPSYRLQAEVRTWPRTPTGTAFNTFEGLPLNVGMARRTQRPFAPSEFGVPALAALENPEQVLVANLLEIEASTSGRLPYSGLPVAQRVAPPDPDGSYPFMLGGLAVRLRPERPFGPKPEGGEPDFEFCTATIDPADSAAVRDAWHRRFDVRVVSVAHWQVVAVTALLPLMWLVLWLRPVLVRRHRRRRGLCLRCGYDVRASADRCPECGEGIANSATSSRRSPVRRPSALVSHLTDR